ncbi:MAG TPA: ROK family protein [Aggregatilineales bacterium]|nr:ROK family protein [Aggregatilineales bacterium]
MPQNVVIGIDLGGTRIRAACMDTDLNMLTRSETLTLDKEGQDAVVQRMIEQARAVWPSNGDAVKSVGISAPGPVNPVARLLVAPPNLLGWHNVPLGRLLTDALGVTTYLGNDANLAALAESKLGAARGYQHVVYLTQSTGIGSGILVNGEMLVGSKGLGAEAGHMMMYVDNERVATLEKEAAGTALGRQARAAIEAGTPSAILDLAGGDPAAIKGYMVGEAAKAGDPLGVKLIERAGMFMGLGIVSLLHLFNPEIVVIGGGVAEGNWDMLIGPMHQAIEANAMDPDYWIDLKIVQAQLGENVSIIGAGALALQHMS